MFIYNIKLNGKSLFKIVFAILVIIVSAMFLMSSCKLLSSSFKVKDNANVDINYIDSNNYTNVLKAVYEDIDTYIGKEICFTGYVYRLKDFNEKQFVLARNMMTNDPNATFVVGFLCECDKLIEYPENSWVKITGTIKKGYYKGEIPIVKIDRIESTEEPEDELVTMPDDTYIPTSVAL
ncbi:MAG: hypothetical protein IJN50_01785 [Clostridia bacterium]|nr:hypothetical protein [Clostridia bacterium]